MSAGAPRVVFAGGGTGGHLYPALALADALRAEAPAAEVMFVGARRGVEARVLPERSVPHVLLPLEPLRREHPWQNWRLVPAMMRSAAGLSALFRSFRPDLVVGTGGYASGPAVAWGILRGIPTAVQEQNSYPGFVTRRVARRVRQIHLAFPEARAHLKPGRRTEVFELGNPIAPPDLSLERGAARERFGLAAEGVLCLVTGGSQGARPVNEALLAALRGVMEGTLPQPPAGFQLLWATGPGGYDAVAERLRLLQAPAWVRTLPYITEMPAALAAADFAVARAGAMSLAELCAWGVPPILVPLPHAAANHQHHNAMALQDAGAALVLEEAELSGDALWQRITALAADGERRAALAARARERGRPDAARRIVAELLRLVREG